MANKETNVAREGGGKTQCFVTIGFGHTDGLETVEVNDWQTSFKLRSEAAAKRVLQAENAPAKSIKWAKKVLLVDSEKLKS